MSKSKAWHVLVVAGDYDIVEQVQKALEDDRLLLHHVFNHREALYTLDNNQFDAALVDAAMFDRYTGAHTLAILSDMEEHPPLIAFAPNATLSDQSDIPAERVITSLDRQIIRHTLFGLLSTDEEVDEYARQQESLLNDALARRIEEIQTLFALSKSLTEVLDLNEVLNRVVESARHLTDAEEGMILLPDEEGGELFLRARVGIDVETARNFRIKTQDTIAGEVFNSGHPAIIGAQGPQKVKTKYFVKSLLYVPILLQGKPIGVLGVNNKTRGDLFDLNHQDLLLNLGSYAAIAIENARIHEDSLQRARELESLVEASQIVNASLSLHEALPNICQQLARVLSVNRTEVYERDEEEGQLRVLARYQRAIWRPGQGPIIDLSTMPAFRAGMLKDVALWIDRYDLAVAAEAEYARRAGVSAMLVVPIRADGRVVGAVQAFFIRPRERMEAADTLAKVRALSRESVSGMLAEPEQTIPHSLFRPAEAINNLLDADWCQLSLLSRDGSKLEVTAEVGTGIWLEKPYPVIQLEDYPELAEVIDRQSVMNLRHEAPASNNSRFLSDIAAHSVLGLPLIQRGRTQGVVLFADTLRPRAFGKRDIDVGRAIVGQAATALENAKLVHDLEQSLQDLRSAQDRLVQTARLSAMGELAAVVAHQINNPLTTIIADAELMLYDAQEGTPDHRSLIAMHRAGKRAASVARRLLAISRPNDPNTPTEHIDVIDTIDGVLSLVQTHIERGGLQIVTKFPREPLPLVEAVRGRLDDIWLNLLMNANDALAGRRDARIGIEVNLIDDLGFIDVVIWDNGPGISDDVKPDIFKPFVTTKPAGEGTGLGLHICRQVVERIGGTISVESEYGHGTRFTVRLPVATDEPAIE